MEKILITNNYLRKMLGEVQTFQKNREYKLNDP